MKSIVAILTKLLIRSRYRIKVNCSLESSPLKGALILPNHPAEIDPVIVSTELWSIAAPRAVVTEPIFQMPVLNWVFKYIRAFSMPDMEMGSGYYKRRRIQQTLNSITAALEQGDNILIYPSGRLSVDGREILGGSSGTYNILQQAKSARIVLVRSRGLWGSRFSKAWTDGLRPDIGTALLSSLKTLLKNFFFLVPKRNVDLVIQEFPAEQLRKKSVQELNQFLEAWYANGEIELASFVPDFFLSKLNNTPPAKTVKEEQLIEILPERREKIVSHLAKLSQKDISEITPTLKLNEDLGLDSLAIAELVTWLHDEFDCTDLELAELVTVNAVLRASVQANKNQIHQESLPTPKAWHKRLDTRPPPQVANASSIGGAFIQSAKRLASHPACSDPLMGVKTYSDLLVSSIVLSEHFKNIPGTHLGILLPASGTSAMVIMAAQFAKKTPVFLNWTAGPRSLEHSVNLLSIKKIVTAGSVLDVINQDLSILDDKFLLLEELRAQTSLSQKVISLLRSRLPTNLLLQELGLDKTSSDETAVVLFTSGSEASPKGVPLSHHNILEDIKGILEIFEFTKNDVVFGFLPPFHSFGLTVTTLLPLLSGTRVSFYPNPNESRKIASGCLTWGVSLLAGTPAFLRGIFSAGSAINFSSLRLLMSGADSLTDDVRQLCSSMAPQALLLEGYGITECSPVVCAQRPHKTSSGVGPPLPGVQVKIVDLELKNFLPEGERGLVLISGPNVFSGYLGPAANPFVELGGLRWYNSGDLGYMSDGALVLAGRLKRFIKIGGEMISLPALEQVLIEKLTTNGQVPSLAIVDKEDPETQRPLLIIFNSLQTLRKEQAQEILKNAGFPSLVKVNEVKFLAELPLLGSGKIDIQSLKRLVS